MFIIMFGSAIYTKLKIKIISLHVMQSHVAHIVGITSDHDPSSTIDFQFLKNQQKIQG